MATRTYGPAFEEGKDGKRIRKQHIVIRDFSLNGPWSTLQELRQELRYPESSISAQLRHLRKEEFGSYDVRKRRRFVDGKDGTWEYKVFPPIPSQEPVQQQLFQ